MPTKTRTPPPARPRTSARRSPDWRCCSPRAKAARCVKAAASRPCRRSSSPHSTRSRSSSRAAWGRPRAAIPGASLDRRRERSRASDTTEGSAASSRPDSASANPPTDTATGQCHRRCLWRCRRPYSSARHSNRRRSCSVSSTAAACSLRCHLRRSRPQTTAAAMEVRRVLNRETRSCRSRAAGPAWRARGYPERIAAGDQPSARRPASALPHTARVLVLIIASPARSRRPHVGQPKAPRTTMRARSSWRPSVGRAGTC